MSLSSELMHRIAARIAGTTSERVAGLRVASIRGGTNSAFHRLSIGDRDYFLKSNVADRLPMFEAEMAATNEIANTATIGVPKVFCVDVIEDYSFIVLEWLDLQPVDEAAGSRFGRALAALHRHTGKEFGWHRNNSVGATVQVNTPSSDWLAFWKEYRLGYQLKLAASNGYTGQLQDLGTRLMVCCDELFSGYSPEPSLLHGNLWHGNTGCSASGEVIVFDHATYYGDRETDLAMTSLFGGFPNTFVTAYNATLPLHEGYELRRDFYNVYHLLNHLNLFGKGYLAQAEATMKRVLISLGETATTTWK